MNQKLTFLHLIKDILWALCFLSTLALLFLIVIPELRDKQKIFLSERYEDEQRKIISQETVTLADRIEKTKNDLAQFNISEEQIQNLILLQLQTERYGVSSYGYFYIVNAQGVLIFHPLQKELEGKDLRTVFSPDGKNMGELFSKALQNSNSAYINYAWNLPFSNTVEEKTTFIMHIGSWDWILATGYYPSDLKNSIRTLRSLSENSINEALSHFLSISIPLLVLIIILSLLVNRDIAKTNALIKNQFSTLEQYKLLLDKSSIVSRTDAQGKIIYVNEQFEKTSGYTLQEVSGHKHNVERHPDTPLELFKDLWETISHGEVWKGIIKNRKADGSSYYKQSTIVPLKNAKGEISEYVSSGQDITELMERRDTLEQAFHTDQLTGLGNRYKLMQDLEKLDIKGAALFDIEDFSAINQLYSSKEADKVLQKLALTVLDTLNRDYYSAYRFQADVFAVLLFADQPQETFTQDMQNLMSVLRSVNNKIGSIPINLRIGMTYRGKESLMYAEIALERAKSNYQTFHICDKDNCECSPNNKINLELIQKLEEAFNNDGIVPYYQPILNIHNGKIEKYECLVRAELENGEILFPNDFLEISKKLRKYQMLTLKVIDKAVSYFRRLPWEFSINLDVEDLSNSETIGFLTATAKEADLANRLVVEILESHELTDHKLINKHLDTLRSQGIKIAIDDFGSGYSNFDYLLKLNPEYVKIDGSIIQKIQTDPRATDLIKTLVDYSHSSGIKSIAEYVDSPKLLEILKNLGVDYAQGWIIGKPSKDASILI